MFAWSVFELKNVKIYKKIVLLFFVLFFHVILAPVFVAT